MDDDIKRVRYASGNCFTVPDFEYYEDDADFYGYKNGIVLTGRSDENAFGHGLAADADHGDECEEFAQYESEAFGNSTGVGAPEDLNTWQEND